MDYLAIGLYTAKLTFYVFIYFAVNTLLWKYVEGNNYLSILTKGAV